MISEGIPIALGSGFSVGLLIGFIVGYLYRGTE